MKKLLSLLSVTLWMVGCVSDPLVEEPVFEAEAEEPVRTRFVHMDQVEQPTEVLVKFKRSFGERIEREVMASKSSGLPTRSGIGPFDEFLNGSDAVSFERVFPVGRFEKRVRESGLHLWYKVGFRNALTPSRLKEELERIPEISVVELAAPIKLSDPQLKRYDCQPVGVSSDGDGAAPMDDPYLSMQWHYHNDGTADEHAKVGADINLFPAWERTKGDPSVVVGVVDGYVQYNHPDLRENMWVNEAEAHGMPGVDDDGNGYVDDVHGYNFVADVPDDDFMAHGTHVAGTIAAVNDNGIGVCGIAGGSGKGDGVRLMACGILSDRYYGDITTSSLGIVYAADNGAVILQNSWGYDEPLEFQDGGEWLSIEVDALKYFIRYAGYDEEGHVVGPMAGGVVIFAAGNSGDGAANRSMMPGAYPEFISVSAVGCDYRPAYYTSYGQWVDLAAPGGDGFFDSEFGGVMSTSFTAGPDDYSYQFMHGTSMACPHVSGVAALVVSYAHSKHFLLTNEQLKDILLSSGRPIESYFTGVKEAPAVGEFPAFSLDFNDYKGKMGNGLVDAVKALDRVDQLMDMPSEHEPPAPVEDVQALVTDEVGRIMLRWTATADCEGNPLESYAIYWRLKELKVENGAVVLDEFTEGPVLVPAEEGGQVGDTLMKLISDLKSNDLYEFGIVGIDRWRSSSEPTVVSVLNRKFDSDEFLYDLRVKEVDSHAVTLEWNELFDATGHPFESYEVRWKKASASHYTDVGYVRATKKEHGLVSLLVDYLFHLYDYQFQVRAFDASGARTEWTPPMTVSLADKFEIEGEADGDSLQYWESRSYRIHVVDRDFSMVEMRLLENSEGWSLQPDGDDYLLSFTGPVSAAGKNKLVLQVEESVWGSYDLSFDYTVVGNEAPVRRRLLPDQYLEGAVSSARICLDDYFTDANLEPLSYAVEVDGESVAAGLEEEGSHLVIRRLKSGRSTVTVRATDHGGLSVEDAFEVMGRQSTEEMELYPNPVLEVMNVRFGRDVEGEIRVRVKNYRGSVVHEAVAVVSPFAPARIDMRGVKRGNYQVEVELGDQVYIGNIIKQ